MKKISDFPKAYRKAVRKVSKKLQTDYVTAYRMILLEALLYDLNPQDAEVADLLIGDYACGSS